MANKLLKSKKSIVKKAGFTLVELSLSIAFIAILSIAIVLIITNTISSYHRGLTLSQLNTTGMDLVNDMRASIQNSVIHSVASLCSSTYEDGDTAKEACEEDGGSLFVTVAREANIAINGKSLRVPVFGAFCSGNYSYIWNSGYFFSDDYKLEDALSPAELRYIKPSTAVDSNPQEATVSDFKLLKVKDESRAVCVSAVYGDKGNYKDDGEISSVFDITEIGGGSVISENPTDIIGPDSNMVIYNISSAIPAESTSGNNAFYSVSFILGTVHGGINVTAGNHCATPEGYNSAVANFDYCAINKFNFAARAVGG